MHQQTILTWAMALGAGLAYGGSALAQDRGYGIGYDAGSNYLQPSPAYDPFRDEGATNPDQRNASRSPEEGERDYSAGRRSRSHHGIRVRKAKVVAVKHVKPAKQSLWLSDKP